MAPKEMEIRPGWFIYRCECGFQHPPMAVRKEYLVAPPTHTCPGSGQLNFKTMLKGNNTRPE